MLQDLLTRADTLRAKLDEAWRILALDAVKEEMAALEKETMAPDFWSDQERAKRESQKLSELKKEYDQWNELRMNIMEAQELLQLALKEKDETVSADVSKRLDELEKKYFELEFTLLFSGDPFDSRRCRRYRCARLG
jgi:peptide chain release factor 2